MKRFVSLLMAMLLCLSIGSVAFAAEGSANTIPENATEHTVAFCLPAQGEMTVPADGIAPYIWGDPSVTMVDHYVYYTAPFYVSDRYFGYEVEGFLDPGIVTDRGYSVSLQHVNGGVISSMSGEADGSLYKVDWVNIYTDGNYRFRIANDTDYTLTVYITYYSWN